MVGGLWESAERVQVVGYAMLGARRTLRCGAELGLCDMGGVEARNCDVSQDGFVFWKRSRTLGIWRVCLA